MKEWAIRIMLLAALAAVGFWAWRTLYPNPERIIKKRLAEMAQTASFSSNQGLAAQAWAASSLAEYFALDVEITLNVPGAQRTFSGRDEVMQVAVTARRICRSLSIRFPDIKVTLSPDKTSAEVSVTGEADVTYASGGKEFHLQELRLRLIKVEREWLIKQVETVKTLS
ncbi:MAG TPA: hypothetical protein PKI20_13160 [Verrucomicrobiota bacterium]|nr:hypothetical protein [Verrucomicrobiota bacterium]HQL78658.1 hypothetical protein [Verrucomicrobiota bacterium]